MDVAKGNTVPGRDSSELSGVQLPSDGAEASEASLIALRLALVISQHRSQPTGSRTV